MIKHITQKINDQYNLRTEGVCNIEHQRNDSNNS
jgi:hypothetical protein